MHDPITQLELGARPGPDGTSFLVWAPSHSSVDLLIEQQSPVPMVCEGSGYWSIHRQEAPPGTRYRYRLDGRDDQAFPDPASRFQPDGVHGPSEVIDAAAFAWTTGNWHAPSLDALVFYELQVGTFSPPGTFRGVMD